MEALSVSHTIVAKSDQLNADDLLGGPITVQVTGVTLADSVEQPVVVALGGGHRPWKPCKTMRRVLIHGWGDDANQWRGRWIQLYRDDSVKWGGEAVGGIRVKAMSHTKPITVSLATTKGKKATHRIEALTPPIERRETSAPPRPLEAFVSSMSKNLVLEADDLAAWALSAGIDLSTLTREGQDALWKGLRPGGTERADFDSWLHGDRGDDQPADELPEGEGREG